MASIKDPVSRPAALADRVKSLRLPDQKQMTAGTPWSRWLVSAGLMAAFLFGGYRLTQWWEIRGKDALRRDADESAAPAGRSSAPVRSTAAQRDSAAPTGTSSRSDVYALQQDGYVVPRHQILVSPKIAGMITRLYVEEGMRVSKGDLLAELESTDYEADLKRARAALAAAQQQLLELTNGSRPEEIEAAQSELEEAQAQRDQLRSEWLRRKQLRSDRVLSDSDYELAESAYHAMVHRIGKLKANLALLEEGPRPERIDLARAEVEAAKADVAKARWRLDNCRITAPISGTILRKNAEEGNIVNPIAFNGSYSVCDIADLSDLEIDLTIQERDLRQISVGQQCEVESRAFPDRRYHGQVSRLMPVADRAKQSVVVRVKVEIPAAEEGVYLKPDMTARVSFLRGPAEPGEVTPRADRRSASLPPSAETEQDASAADRTADGQDAFPAEDDADGS